MKNKRFVFNLSIPADEFLAVYKGQANRISVVAVGGKRIEFSAEKVRSYLTHRGVYGTFVMETSPSNQFLSIQRISVG